MNSTQREQDMNIIMEEEMLHERVAELEKQLYARHEAEHHRLRSLSIGIRRELQGIIGI